MSTQEKQGLIRKLTPADIEMAEVEQLIEICNKYEGLRMRLDTEPMRKRPGDNVYDFLYYEDGKLVGYLALDSFGRKQKEVTGMVHPEYRRKGIFRTLLEAAKEECLDMGVQKLILVCEENSLSGLAFVDAIGAHHDFSEYEMVLGTFKEKFVFDDRFRFQEANASDLDIIVSIMATDLDEGESIEGLEQWVGKALQDPNRHFYLGRFGGDSVSCGEPIGCLRLDEMDKEIGIYAFIVRPDYRGRGYGRQMLEEAIRTIQSRSSKGIMLDVDTNNTNAIGLYRSCGFEVRATYAYYGLDLQ